jgi:RNA polymerase sigma factor (sigma-70 family)
VSRPPDPPSPDPPHDSTVGHARNAQQDPAHPSWNDLLVKIGAYVQDRFGRERMPVPFDIGDLVAKTQARVLRDLTRIEVRDRPSFWGWVHRVAHHTLTDMRRRAGTQKRGQGRVEQFGSPDDSSFAPTIADVRAETASGLARARETHEAILVCLQSLRQETADVLRLRLLESEPFDGIARIVGRDKTVTVRSIFHRGIEQLAECLRRKGFEDVVGDDQG